MIISVSPGRRYPDLINNYEEIAIEYHLLILRGTQDTAEHEHF